MASADGQSDILDAEERKQARDRALPHAIVIHEVVRKDGEAELERPVLGLAWSGLAAGLSIGFSFLAQAYLKAALPDAPWADAISAFGYTLGFLIVVLGRQQLFTETTLTAVIPFLERPTAATLVKVGRVWGVVLLANLVGTLVFGVLSAQRGVFTPEAFKAMGEISKSLYSVPPWQAAVRAGSAGWLIGLMVWLLPAANTSRPAIIILLTYVVGFCHFPHVIAGSVEAAFGVASGQASASDYLGRFLLPTLVGNIIGGSALAALLNHAPVAEDKKG